MAIRIQFDTDNSAFEDDPSAEAARIIRNLADEIERDGLVHAYRQLRDFNGNTVGDAEIHIEPEG